MSNTHPTSVVDPKTLQRPTGRVYDTSDNPFMTTPKKYGDPFPVYFDGVWHLYTLQGNCGCVHHLTSCDLVRWTEHLPAMTGEDGDIATGVVLRHNSKYYLFYTIEQEAIGLVVSDNPWHFDKNESKTVAAPDPDVYPNAKPFRDVFVFYHEEEQLWWMLCEANTKVHGVQVALLKAEQLEGPWKPCSALYTQPRDGNKLNEFVSCPQIIHYGDAWYLTYLNNATSYHVADNPDGPWGERKGHYNSDFLTAGSRSGTDGKRRLNWGFFTVRPTPENPQAKPRYGGPLGIGREMIFGADNTIGVRPLPELIAAIRQSEYHPQIYPLVNTLAGTWTINPEQQDISCNHAKGGSVLIDIPEGHSDYYFETDVVFGDEREPVSVTVRSTALQDSGYRIVLRPKDGSFEITEHTGKRQSFLTKTHEFGKTAELKVFVCDGQLEAFVDGFADLSTRVLQNSNSKIILEANDRNTSFKKPQVHYFKQNQKPQFRLVLEDQKPVFSVEPGQTRMATCYRDRQGVYHLFADHMQESTISWTAEIRHYRSPDLRNWELVETAVPKGRDDAPDAYGAASPHVLATDERIYLFYAGRANPVGGRVDTHAPRGKPGYMAGCILLASAKADQHGAPAEPFRKHGVVVEPEEGWDAMRLDDPCAVLDNGTVHIFFKGFDNNRKRDNVKVGYARAAIADLKFTKHPGPVLAVPGGGEMPRVFRQANRWHLFYHHFGGGGTCWRHHTSHEPTSWTLADACFFAGHPSGGPRDIMMIYGMNGQLLDEPKMLACANEEGANKLWLYRLTHSF